MAVQFSARFRYALALPALAFAGACVDGRDPTGLDMGSLLALSVAPSFAVSPTPAEAGRLTRVRVFAFDAVTRDSLGAVEQEIDPDAEEWRFDLVLEVARGKTYQVVVAVELISDLVEWSGRTAPMPLAAGAEPTDVKQVTLLRGPLDNLTISALDLTEVPERLDEGARGQASSRIQGGGAGSRAFYTSLTPAVLEVSREGAFRAIAPGLAKLEARAGSMADTVVISVPEQSVEVQDVATVSGGVGDSVDRLAPALQDAAGAQAIVQSLGDFETAITTRRPSRIQDAITAARAALAGYGTPEIRYQDGPELSLIELVLDYTERVVLAAVTSASSGR
jgi:hypothetical protein